MKRYIILVLIAVVTVAGCDRGFDELNTNKIDPTSLDPVFVLNRAVVDITFTSTANTQAMLCYNFPIVQQILTPFGSSLTGGNYNQLHRENATRLWNYYYPNIVKQIVDVVERTRDVPEQHNLHQFARIWKAYVFMALTDTYGDIPYFEAGKGYTEGVRAPVYDAQEAVYQDILKELEEASSGLDESAPVVTSDILYGGNLAQWKRFGFSLMLRAAMRLTKVDPATAETYVGKAVAGGLMESNADNAKNRHSSLYINWMGEQLSGREKANFYLAEPFVDYLLANDDPRLPVYAIRYVGAQNGTQQTASRATSDPDMQIGMPFGYNDVSIVATYEENGVASLWDYSQANQTTVVTQTAPEYFVTYAQTQLLLAEAIVRGWATGDAATVFENGIRANLEQMAEYGPGGVIDGSAIEAYLAAHPLDMANALEQINTQYWVASFLNGNELFANFRRSGYPSLTPNPYPGSEITGNFIRRLVYPDSEYVVNGEHVAEANARQGADDLNTRVWWDTE
ncbi:SusD/RagB family nutrient-binding outer membrane lipoprotein [Parapedobacter lycopersici]|uniref:SusD/RagB family nutrient-binding outer membrane lipoprotein n=1 Tax=Parapedobacter lycopersici TaxID=1864939 RepID=UPI00214D2A5B|nr:SusD/RagB family nutrient-binding outer membrane lipoprotein [Parapedobacter lycopersici]